MISICSAPLRLRAGRDSFLLAAALVFCGGLHFNDALAETAFRIPAPAIHSAASAATGTMERGSVRDGLKTAVFAGGCFWGVQGVFQHTKGVTQALSGYAGGEAITATYDEVTTDTTGHAESVQVTFDPRVVTYGQLLHIFFSVVHDPTQLNRQGPDVGTHYRSALFYVDEGQKEIAQTYIKQLGETKAYPGRIVTDVTPLKGFYPAEDYHQDYATLHPDSGYIFTFDLPKIANLKTMFPEHYRGEPQLVNPANGRTKPQ